MEMTEESEKGITASSKGGKEITWGTLEELLLASAVVRHGTRSWDSIAREVQKPRIFRNIDNNQSSHNHHDNNSSLFSPLNCERKYRDLTRRFNVSEGLPATDETTTAAVMERGVREMVNELKKLRVEELRREVERHDNSIVSLELKVKRLEEERENSLKIKGEKNEDGGGRDAGNGGEADLRTKLDQDCCARSNPDESCGKIDVKSVSGERENGSFNESNSMGQNREGNNAGTEPDEPNRNIKPDPVRSKGVVNELVKDSSSSGGGGVGFEGSGCRMINKTRTILEKETSSRRPNRLESDSVSESKREEGSKQQQQHSSDVQSSASLSRRRRRRGWRDGNSSGDEIETEELSPGNKRLSVKSQPLIKFMEILQSHKHGLVFRRRLPSQDTEKYRNLIRQHMDLETVESKLDRGVYCDCQRKLYRDLLVIFTNAILFFRKSTAEHTAARELRKFVSKEIAKRLPNNRSRLKPAATVVSTVKTELESRHHQVMKKPRSSSTIVVCRRRTGPSSLKPLSSSSDYQKKNQAAGGPTSSSTSDQGGGGGITRERSSLGGGRGRTSVSTSNNKKKIDNYDNGNNNYNNKKEETMSSNDDDDDQPLSLKAKQLAKKQGVVKFLKRMEQNSPLTVGKDGDIISDELDEQLEDDSRMKRKSSNVDINKKKGKRGEPAAAAPRRTSGRRSVGSEEKNSPVTKRGAGRPTRRKASMGGTPAALGKKKRVEKDAEDSGRPNKKRPRR